MEIDFAKLHFAIGITREGVEALRDVRRSQWISNEARGDDWAIALFVDSHEFNSWFNTLWENRVYKASIKMVDVYDQEANRRVFREYTSVASILDAYPTDRVYEEIRSEAFIRLKLCAARA